MNNDFELNYTKPDLKKGIVINDCLILEFFQSSDFLELPFIQRDYQWDRNLVFKLIEHLLVVGVDSDEDNSHFFGSFYVQYTRSDQERSNGYLIIDGGQRIYTFTLLAVALVEIIDNYFNTTASELLPDDKIEDLRSIKKLLMDTVLIKFSKADSYNEQLFEPRIAKLKLVNKYKNESHHMTDWANFISFLNSDDEEQIRAHNIIKIYQDLKRELQFLVDNPDYPSPKGGRAKSKDKKGLLTLPKGISFNNNIDWLLVLYQGLIRSQVMIADLGDECNIAKFFENLNNSNKTLKESDLIRSYLVEKYSDGSSSNKALFEERWLAIEGLNKITRPNSTLVKDKTIRHLDIFLYAFITGHPKNNHKFSYKTLYDDFIPSSHLDKEEDPMYKLWSLAVCYRELLNPSEIEHAKISLVISNFIDLTAKCYLKGSWTSLPFLLWLYYSYKSDEITPNDFIKVVNLLEVYLIRLGFRKANDQMAKVIKGLYKKLYEADFEDVVGLVNRHLRNFPVGSDTYMPTDEDLRQLFRGEQTPVFFNNLKYILANLNHNKLKKAAPSRSSYTLEHIFPTKAKYKDWQDKISEEEFENMQSLVENLGNLSVISGDINSSIGNKNYDGKKEYYRQTGGLNLELTERYSEWNAANIQDRYYHLLEQIIITWPYPDNEY